MVVVVVGMRLGASAGAASTEAPCAARPLAYCTQAACVLLSGRLVLSSAWLLLFHLRLACDLEGFMHLCFLSFISGQLCLSGGDA